MLKYSAIDSCIYAWNDLKLTFVIWNFYCLEENVDLTVNEMNQYEEIIRACAPPHDGRGTLQRKKDLASGLLLWTYAALIT